MERKPVRKRARKNIPGPSDARDAIEGSMNSSSHTSEEMNETRAPNPEITSKSKAEKIISSLRSQGETSALLVEIPGRMDSLVIGPDSKGRLSSIKRSQATSRKTRLPRSDMGKLFRMTELPNDVFCEVKPTYAFMRIILTSSNEL